MNAPATRSSPGRVPNASAPPAGSQPETPAAALAPPEKPRDAQEFIRSGKDQPSRTLKDIRQQRREVREGNRTVIVEGDRTIIRQDNRVIIRHNEAHRFAVGARDIDVRRTGKETTTVIVRPDGSRIINVTDERGRLVRRERRDARGRTVVIIDERFVGPRRADIEVQLPPPVVRIPRERYIVEAGAAGPAAIYGALQAAPVEQIERRYTVEQVRYNAPLRERMPRVDLDINFETSSWQLTPAQIEKLSVVAAGIKRAIGENPREVFLIEGHTDAVGAQEDNLSLSDRRAEAVAVALTEQFQVPAENLVTQGYGEQNPKVETQEESRANRRVSVRRVTPLIHRTSQK